MPVRVTATLHLLALAALGSCACFDNTFHALGAVAPLATVTEAPQARVPLAPGVPLHDAASPLGAIPAPSPADFAAGLALDPIDVRRWGVCPSAPAVTVGFRTALGAVTHLDLRLEGGDLYALPDVLLLLVHPDGPSVLLNRSLRGHHPAVSVFEVEATALPAATAGPFAELHVAVRLRPRAVTTAVATVPASIGPERTRVMPRQPRFGSHFIARRVRGAVELQAHRRQPAPAGIVAASGPRGLTAVSFDALPVAGVSLEAAAPEAAPIDVTVVFVEHHRLHYSYARVPSATEVLGRLHPSSRELVLFPTIADGADARPLGLQRPESPAHVALRVLRDGATHASLQVLRPSPAHHVMVFVKSGQGSVLFAEEEPYPEHHPSFRRDVAQLGWHDAVPLRRHIVGDVLHVWVLYDAAGGPPPGPGEHRPRAVGPTLGAQLRSWVEDNGGTVADVDVLPQPRGRIVLRVPADAGSALAVVPGALLLSTQRAYIYPQLEALLPEAASLLAAGFSGVPPLQLLTLVAARLSWADDTVGLRRQVLHRTLGQRLHEAPPCTLSPAGALLADLLRPAFPETARRLEEQRAAAVATWAFLHESAPWLAQRPGADGAQAEATFVSTLQDTREHMRWDSDAAALLPLVDMARWDEDPNAAVVVADASVRLVTLRPLGRGAVVSVAPPWLAQKELTQADLLLRYGAVPREQRRECAEVGGVVLNGTKASRAELLAATSPPGDLLALRTQLQSALDAAVPALLLNRTTVAELKALGGFHLVTAAQRLVHGAVRTLRRHLAWLEDDVARDDL